MIRKIFNFFSLLRKTPNEESNVSAYAQESIINYYKSQQPYLHEAEKSIIKAIGDELPNFTMLDIGIGTGRTTFFFSPVVKKYTGVDYSQGMVEACRSQYKNYEFEVQDVRKLKYANDSFDFVFFSFNGLDSISASDRVVALNEIFRVLKPAGFFAVSTHNLNAAVDKFKFPLSFNLKKWYKVIVLRKVNRKFRSFSKVENAMIFDGTHGYEISNYYCTPQYQSIELANHGFSIVKIFDIDGKVIDEKGSYHKKDLWLHYLCRKQQRV